jgi:alkaline phosphatase
MILSGAVYSAAPARNLIIFIVDGMGPSDRQLGELALDKGLAMNNMPVIGLMRTSSVDLDITDSAASATAMFCGKKTYNGVLGYDEELDELTSVMELAEAKGMNTGIITTSALYDATCAAMYASEFDRTAKKSISTQLLSSGIDLMIGGGRSYIKPESDNADKGEPAQRKGPAFYYSLPSLRASASLSAICLLADEELTPEIDRQKDEARLTDMLKEGLALLEASDKPFMLLVESGAVDRMSHDNDAAGALAEMLSTDEAVAVCLDFARTQGDTLVIVAADHETGGLSLGAAAGYKIGIPYLKTVRSSASQMAADAASDWGSLYSILSSQAHLSHTEGDGMELIAASSDPAREIGRMVSARANISWGTSSHTAVPVVVSAQGPGEGLFQGYYDNTALFGKMRASLGL